MDAFSFKTSAESEAYCREIISEMVRLFGITPEEAIGRMNRLWHGQDLSGEYDEIFRDYPETLAKDIYYGHGIWWQTPPNELKPRPYP